VIVPSSMVNDTSSTARFPPNDFEIAWAVSMKG
jgi:hypothetical protein